MPKDYGKQNWLYVPTTLARESFSSPPLDDRLNLNLFLSLTVCSTKRCSARRPTSFPRVIRIVCNLFYLTSFRSERFCFLRVCEPFEKSWNDTGRRRDGKRRSWNERKRSRRRLSQGESSRLWEIRRVRRNEVREIVAEVR